MAGRLIGGACGGLACCAAAVAMSTGTAAAQPVPLPYQASDLSGGGFHDILPPGENGLVSVVGLVQYELNKTQPAHSFDQFSAYQNLLYGSAGLTTQDLPKYFKDSSFGIAPGHLASVESPRSDVVIARDTDFGVPHIYGETRAGTMFGVGYAAAEDKLFAMDVLRHAGRAQLSSFAGGSAGNRSLDQTQLLNAPYTEVDRQRQFDNLPKFYGADGQRIVDDATSFVAGINAYIDLAKLDPTKMPGEYAAILRPLGPDPWKLTDLIAGASIVAGQLGKGGGNQLSWALVLAQFKQRFGAQTGQAIFADWRARNDPEAPTTVFGRRFPYELPPARPAPGSAALPDPGSVSFPNVVTAADGAAAADLTQAPPSSGLDRRASTRRVPVVRVASASTAPRAMAAASVPANAATVAAARGARPPAAGGLVQLPAKDSNALLVAGRHTASGHPIAVMGPQISYFVPELLMDEDIHGPGIDARGAAFVGLNLYVQLGHGGDYAWSATSAGQDIVHTFAVALCDPNGGRPSMSSNYYMFRGSCQAMAPVSLTNQWSPNLADSTASGSETLTVYRTALGPVTARAMEGGQPIAYTQLRSTYGHEIDSALGFSDFNNPDRIHNARDFQRAADRIGYTFNWLYADNRDIAYFNSGANPVAAANVDPTLPVNAQFEWQHFNPDTLTADYTPFDQHPQVINQDFLTSWNNKQARAYSASGSEYGPIYRSQLLDQRIAPLIAAGRRMTLPQLVSAMEDAGTVDLRANADLGLLLRVIGQPSDPQLAAAVADLRSWLAAGGHRFDPNRTGTYEHSTAIAILDAWWPLLVRGEFQPVLGPGLYSALTGQLGIDNPPNNGGAHLGSAYDTGWWGYVNKDLRALLGDPVKGRFGRVYCGGGSLGACRSMLSTTLGEAIAAAGDRGRLYADQQCAAVGRSGDQECYDAIFFRAVGAVQLQPMAWVNRPTYQQALEISGHRYRAADDVYTQPPSTTCTSRRRLVFHLARLRPLTVQVFIAGRLARTVRGRGAGRIVVSLLGRPAGKVRVRLVVRAVAGRRIVLRHTVLTCTRR